MIRSRNAWLKSLPAIATALVMMTDVARASPLVGEAHAAKTTYERQEEVEQKVRVWGDTAVVTALLGVKGTEAGKSFEYKLWFSDTYVRGQGGWRYVFGQASIPLPQTP